MKVTLGIEMICNSNFTSAEMASLRILEVSPKVDEFTLGTDRFSQISTIYPLTEDKFFDYEYGYLNKNLT